jgi:hypothetical protein
MNKYKICKLVNNAGEEWYQIHKKGLFFWYWVCSYEYFGARLTISTIKKFLTIEQAKEYIKNDIEYIKKGQIKKVECLDYE